MNAPYERPQLLLKCRPVAARNDLSANMAACGDQCMKLSGPAYLFVGQKGSSHFSPSFIYVYICTSSSSSIFLNNQSIEPKVEPILILL